MKIKDKKTEEIITLPKGSYKAGTPEDKDGAFIVPLQCYYMRYYELVED